MRRILILGGTTEARRLAERLAGRADLAVTVSLAGRTAAPAAQAVPVRSGGFGGAAGPRRLSRGRTHRRADRRHPSLRRQHLGQCRRGGGASRACPCWRCAGRHGCRVAGDHWTEVADPEAAVQALGPSPRRVFLALGRSEIGRFAQAPQHFYLVRSVDPVDPPLAVPHAAYVTGRGPFTEAEDRAIAAHACDRDRRRQEQRRQRDLRQDRGGARARPRGDHAAPSALCRRRRPSRPSRRRWRGSIMRSALRRERGV